MRIGLFIFLLGCLAVLAVTGELLRRLWLDERSRRRLMADEPVDLSAVRVPGAEASGRLARWLMLAGLRGPNAVAWFVTSTLVLLLVGSAIAVMLSVSGAIQQTAAIVGLVPGNALDIVLPVLYGLPWIIVIIFALLPALLVRNLRRKRVRLIERDLPITLELLSTLAESGLALDAGIDRVVASGDAGRPLASELRTFRAETLSGRPRVGSYRRLARRVQVTAFSSFVSAVVQAEQVGTGIAAVLRRQADDVRDRRRERAIEAANAMPVKRLVPLAICFLPGIFVWALGPAVSDFFNYVSVFTRTGGGH